jgi:hypothetical protein
METGHSRQPESIRTSHRFDFEYFQLLSNDVECLVDGLQQDKDLGGIATRRPRRETSNLTTYQTMSDSHVQRGNTKT